MSIYAGPPAVSQSAKRYSRWASSPQHRVARSIGYEGVGPVQWLRHIREQRRSERDLRRDIRATATPMARAQLILEKLIDDFIPLARPTELQGVREALLSVNVDEYGERLDRHHELSARAAAGDGDAALKFFSAARSELVALLRANGQDASLFEIDHPRYRPTDA